MRLFKKLLSISISLIMAAAVMLGFSAVSSAADEPNNNVSLTVGENIVSHYYIDSAYYREKGCDSLQYSYNSTNEKEEYNRVESGVKSLGSDDVYVIDAYQAAAQIAEPTVIEIYKDGEVFDTVRYSSKTYCDSVISMTDEELAQAGISKGRTLSRLCKAIVAYGKSAQEAFNYNASTVDGATTITDDYAEELGIPSAAYTPTQSKTAGDNVSFRTASFICTSSAKMRFYLNVKDESDTTNYGEPVITGIENFTYEKGYVENNGAKQYFIQVNNIKPVDFDAKINISYAGASVSMSVLDYAGAVINSAAMNAQTKTLAKSLIIYNAKAEDFFFSHDTVLHAANAASCTEAGNIAYYTCNDCDKIFADSYGDREITLADTVVAPLGHNYEEAVTAPTCTEQGFTTYTCSRCGDTYKDNYTPATGHTYGAPSWSWVGNDTDGYTSATATFTCTKDASHTEAVTDSSIDYAETVAPQPGVEGEGTYTASVTFGGNTYTDTKTVAIEALPVIKATFTHSDNLANVENYLYRAGNSNAITLGTLFKVADETVPSSADVNVTITNVDSANTTAAGTFTKNATDWTQGTVKFTGEGVVKVTIKEADGEAYVLPLEVVPGTNYTEGATVKNNTNSVLLGNVVLATSSGNVAAMTLSNKSFYGNGFTLDASGSGISSRTNGLICLTNTIFDNVVVKGPTFTEYQGSFGNDYYASTVWVYNGTNSVISNCHITGAASPVRVMGDVTIENTVLSGGIYANLEFKSGNAIIDGVTTVNKQNGLGIVFDTDCSAGSSITLKGELTQHNFISENTKMANSAATNLKDRMFGSAYSKFQFTSGGTKYVNTGIISMSNYVGENQIVDLRSDKKNYSGAVATMSFGSLTVNGYVYTMENTDPSALETSYTEPEYSPSEQRYYEPVFTWAVPSGDNVPAGGDAHCYKDSNGVLQIQFLSGGSKTLSVASLPSVKKYGRKVIASSVTCTNKNGISVPVNNGNVTFSEAGDYTLTYTYNDDLIFDETGADSSATKTYTKTVKVTVAVKKNAPNGVITCTSNTGAMIWGAAGSSFDRDYQPAAPIFENMVIKDYDENGDEYTVLDGANQASFLSSIASVTADSDNKTGFTILLADGTKLYIKCGAPWNSGTLEFKKYNNAFYMCGSKASNNPQTITWKVTSYTYTGRNGVAVTYSTARSFTSSADDSNYVTLSNLTANKFLMLDAQGGTVSPTYYSASPATLPTPEREGYTFLNWNTKADGTGTAKSAGASQTFSSTTTLYAIWAENVTVSFDTNGGGSAPAPISAGAGTTNTLPSASLIGAWLEGWYTEADGGTRIGNAGDSFTVPASDTTYFANWETAYTVSYNANGGTVDTESDTYMGSALTLPSPTNGAKTFEGWYTEAQGGTKVGTAGDLFVPTLNIELFAHWSDNILVTFDANGGTAATNSDTYDRVTPITLPSASWAGHQFNGWYTEASGGTKIGNAGDSYTPSENVTVFAQWTAYTVTYDATGGSVSPASAAANDSGTVTLATPTRTGYTFNGWYTQTSGGTKIGNAGDSYTPSADITIHAQWNIASYKINISQNNSTTTVNVNGNIISNGGSVVYDSVVSVYLTYSEADSRNFTVKQGNTNVTLYSDEACTQTKTGTDEGQYYFKMPAGDVTITSTSTKASSCIAPDTLITLADGSQKRADELTGDEDILVWNFETGEYDSAKLMFIDDSDAYGEYDVVTLHFSDGTETKLISEHGYFDADKAEYVYITEDNFGDYIGDSFVKLDSIENNTYKTVTLVSAEVNKEKTTPFGPTATYPFGFFVDGMFSMPGGISGMFNIFEVNSETMTYDSEAMQQDIETYGLFTYDDFKDLVPEDVFDSAGCAYLKVAMGKGLITWEEIESIASRYVPFVTDAE